MHGVIYVKGIIDPEGFFIKKIRSTVSKNCKISLSYDLLGQMTNSIIKNDGFVTQDIKRIKNLFREKPIYPFQKNFKYNIAI